MRKQAEMTDTTRRGPYNSDPQVILPSSRARRAERVSERRKGKLIAHNWRELMDDDDNEVEHAG